MDYFDREQYDESRYLLHRTIVWENNWNGRRNMRTKTHRVRVRNLNGNDHGRDILERSSEIVR